MRLRKPTQSLFLLMESLDNLLNNDIIRIVSKSKKFVPHFHIPLQSGSNEILRNMHRRYLRDLYAEKVEKIKYFMPKADKGSDVIVGFPGESYEHFMNLSYLHIFTFLLKEKIRKLFKCMALFLKI